MEPPLSKTQSSVDRLYEAVKDMAVTYELKPGERLNEGALAKRLGASRTPLREALNRLNAEGFLTFEVGKGFFCREFRPREIYELYQLRSVLEQAAVRLFIHETGPDDGGRSPEELVALDEHFHEELLAMVRNAEMLRVLRNVNARIKFFRWIDMEQRRTETQSEHGLILAALRERDPELAAERMGRHIERRLDQITAAIKEGYSRIYLSGS
jgi:DNA-binding GntR family transcriptional regulator